MPTAIQVTGENLIGEFFLRKDKKEYKAMRAVSFASDKANLFSDAKVVILVFDTDAPAGKGYELVIRNVAGTAEAIPGFVVIEKK